MVCLLRMHSVNDQDASSPHRSPGTSRAVPRVLEGVVALLVGLRSTVRGPPFGLCRHADL